MEKSSRIRERWTLIIMLMALGASEADDKFRCGPGINTPGVTVPSGDIILEYGSPLEILCVLSPTVVSQGFNSSNLMFYHTSNLIQPKFITPVNESTARLYIEKPVPMKDMYYCKLVNGTEELPVCLNNVVVGFRPREVLNFSCVSHNWENLNCSWVPPPNYVKTIYTLMYHFPDLSDGNRKYPCPDKTDFKGKNYCFWDQTTITPYRQPHEYYNFVLKGKNTFGVITTEIKFHHYANVIPSKAANLTAIERTSNKVLIQWSVVFPMQNFPPGVVQKVEYQSEWDPRNHWQVVDTSSLNIKNATHQLDVTGLKYANSLYDLRVFMRSGLAVGEEMWSQPATITIKTKATVPGAAPKTDIGSFEVAAVGLTSQDVYIYWQRIPEYLYNGDNFGYQVSVYENGVPRNLQPIESTSAYAKFRGLSLNSYRFKILSVNQEGPSEDYSEVFIPSQRRSLAEPLSFTKIAFEQHIYELSWKPPVTNRQIFSYTIFWCDNKKDRPYQCTGTLNWTRVSNDVTIKNITMPDEKIYQFAISANTKTESSGMVWASCVVIHNKIIGKMKSIWINRIGPSFIEVGWKLECSDRIGVVTGFQISYCPIVSPHNLTCRVEAKNTTIKGDGMTIRGNVTDLTPYTTYMIMVAVFTKNSIGQWSDRLYNTTLEAAPDMAPQNVSVSEVTNTSMLVQWLPPLSMNGVLRCYLVHYNGLLQKVEVPNTQVRLRSLSSFAMYNVSVSACTVACSAQSQPIQALTAIGCPGKMERPKVKFVNSSQVEVLFNPPSYAGGLLDRYEVKMVVIDNSHNITDILNTTENRLVIPIEDCVSGRQHHTYSFSVRAVNYANQSSFNGPWSEAGEGNCYSAGAEENLWIMIWVVICLIIVTFLVAFTFLGKRLYEKYNLMRAVEVKLPPGLAPVIDKSSDLDYHTHLNLYGWGPPPMVDKQELSPPDQEVLLQKKGVETEDSSLGKGGGNSRGCNSGHESVAYLLTGGTHIFSDSGAEADQLNNQKTNSLDEMFTQSSTASSLRQRNKAVSSSSEASMSRWEQEPYVMLGRSSSSLVKSSQNLSETKGIVPGYSLLEAVGESCRPTPIATGSVPLDPSPYVAHPPCWFDKEPPSPIKSYVMAGEKDTVTQYCRLGKSDYVPHKQSDSGQ